MLTQTVVKDDGYGPYLFVLPWKRRNGLPETQYAVFSTWSALAAFREAITANGHTADGWELAVDHVTRE